jgi:hypothetical protein
MPQGPEQRMWSGHIRPYLESRRQLDGLFYRKIHGSRFQSGLPDLFVSFVDASGLTRSTWFEMKAPGKRPTPRQYAVADQIATGGMTVYLAVTVEDVRAWAEDRYIPINDFRQHGTPPGNPQGRRSLYLIRTHRTEV